jgi:hypothetical protein
MTKETELLRRQCGVITRAQARAAGRTPYEVDRLVTVRRWVPVLPRVYRAADHPDEPAARVWAAVLWAGEGAVLSGLAAAWWHGLAPTVAVDRAAREGVGESAERTVGPVTVTVPRRRAPRSRAGVTVRRRDLDPRDRGYVRGLGVTGRELSVLEAAVELGAAGGPWLDRLVGTTDRGPAGGAGRWGSETVPVLGVEDLAVAYLRALGCRGTMGGHALLVAAADRATAAARRRVVRALTAARIGGWRIDHAVCGFSVGVAFPGLRLVVEAADPASTLDAERAARERWRREVLGRAGWEVLGYTATDPPAEVVARILASARLAS